MVWLVVEFDVKVSFLICGVRSNESQPDVATILTFLYLTAISGSIFYTYFHMITEYE